MQYCAIRKIELQLPDIGIDDKKIVTDLLFDDAKRHRNTPNSRHWYFVIRILKYSIFSSMTRSVIETFQIHFLLMELMVSWMAFASSMSLREK